MGEQGRSAALQHLSVLLKATRGRRGGEDMFTVMGIQ